MVWPHQARAASVQRRAAARAERTPRVHDGAADALRLATQWAAEIEAGEVTQADIARREGVTRARVTQVLSLLDLDDQKQEEVLRGDVMWSIRQALREVGRHYT